MDGKARSKKILAIDWDSRTLRVVHAYVGKRGPRIDRLLSVAIPGDVDRTDPQQLGAHIRRVLYEEGIHTRHAVADIPRGQATLNTLHLPCQIPDELPGIVRIQVAKQLTFPVDDAVIDFVVAPHEPEATMADVLVAAVRHEVVGHYKATLAAAGLKPDRIGLRPYSNREAARLLLQHSMPERLVMIDVGASFTEINALRDSFLTFSRAAEVAVPAERGEFGEAETDLDEESEGADRTVALTLSVDDSGPEGESGEAGAAPPSVYRGPSSRVVNSLVSEVSLSLEAYRVHDAPARPDHIVVAGDTGVEEALQAALHRRFGVPVEMYNPAASFGWEPDEGADASGFAAALGAVLAYADEKEAGFDFLHPKRTDSQARRRLRKAPMIAVVLFLFLASGVVGLVKYTEGDRQTLAKINAKIAEYEDAAGEHRSFLNVVEEVRSFEEDQQVWVDVLYDIIANLPPQEELTITQIDMNHGDRRVVLKTKAKDRNTALEAVNRLSAYRIEGRDKPRFRAGMRTQTEKPREYYPFHQDISIEIVGDGPATTKGD